MSADKALLAWDVVIKSIKRDEMFRVLVDARTGDVLMRTSLTNDISNATYRVYADSATLQPFDSPAPFSPGHSTPSSVQPAVVPRQLVTTQAENTTASPNGWINDGGQETLGNNVDAHTDLNDDDAADLPRPNGGVGRVFDFSADLALAPSTYTSAAVTHLFYLNNWIHDKLYAVGFTESAGNFQTDNFGRRRQAADAHDHSGDAWPGRAHHHAVRGDGRRLPARRSCAIRDQPARLRAGLELAEGRGCDGLGERRCHDTCALAPVGGDRRLRCKVWVANVMRACNDGSHDRSPHHHGARLPPHPRRPRG